MSFRHPNVVLAWTFVPVLALALCGKGPKPAAPLAPVSARMTIAASADANPDASGRPSPVVVRVYQVFGTEMFGWDHNREQPPADRPLYYSREEAETAADYAHQLAGHLCDEVCYRWRALM